jgi:hypothetical protein
VNRAAPAPWRPGSGYVAFVAALVSTVMLSPFLIFGLVALLTVQSHRALVEPIPGGKTTTGIILSVVREDCGRSGCGYQPTIQYTDGNGRAHQFTAPETHIDPAAGSAVRVSYDPGSPDDAHDLSISPSYWDYTTGTILTASCAVMVLGVTVTAVLIARSRRR